LKVVEVGADQVVWPEICAVTAILYKPESTLFEDVLNVINDPERVIREGVGPFTVIWYVTGPHVWLGDIVDTILYV